MSLVQDATGMDERTGRGQGHHERRDLLTRGHQVRDAFSTLKVEFNCWRKFRDEGRIHTFLNVYWTVKVAIA